MMWPRRMSLRPANATSSLICFPGSIRSAEEGDDGHAGISNSDVRREHDMQTALLEVKRKFGRNAVIKAMDMEDGATGQDRNRQIGGHRA